MVNELVDTSIVGADMGFGHLPEPIVSGIGGWSHDPASTGAISRRWRQTELNCDRFQSPDRSQEEQGASRVGLPAVLGVDPVEEREVGIMVVQHVQLVLLQCLQDCEPNLFRLMILIGNFETFQGYFGQCSPARLTFRRVGR